LFAQRLIRVISAIRFIRDSRQKRRFGQILLKTANETFAAFRTPQMFRHE
jgi:hypothetical protein